MIALLFARTLPILALFATLAAGHAAPTYTITVFNFPTGYTNSFAEGINENGDVVGSGQVGIGGFVPFLYSGEVLMELGPANLFDSANAINDSGMIVGQIGGTASKYLGGGVWSELAPLANPGFVYDLNNSGVAVGESYIDSAGAFHAIRYIGGVAIDLGTLRPGNAGVSQAYAINSSGVIAGNSDYDESECHAVIFNLNGTITDLGALPDDDCSEARDINDFGYVVGTSGDRHAFLWNPNTLSMMNLGLLPGFEYAEGYGINNAGLVVGRMATFDGSTETAFLYDGATLWDLNTLVPGLAAAGVETLGTAGAQLRINNAGQIIGTGFALDGHRIGYVLTPVAVPEPGTWGVMVGLGLGAMIFLRRRRSAGE